MTGAGADLTVRDVTVRAVTVPMRRPLATRVGEFAQWPLVLVDLSTEQGITGRSYLAPYRGTAAAALLPVLRELGAGLRGRPVAPVTAFEASRGWFAVAGYQGLALSAVAGLDMALWDALAQAAGLSLAAFAGGTPGPVPAYNSNGLGLIPPAAAGDEALEATGIPMSSHLYPEVSSQLLPSRPPRTGWSGRTGPIRCWRSRSRSARVTCTRPMFPAAAWPGTRTRSPATRSSSRPGDVSPAPGRRCAQGASDARRSSHGPDVAVALQCPLTIVL